MLVAARASCHCITMQDAKKTPQLAIVGAGPAGLIAAETAASAGVKVTVYDRMATPLRKFLLAGRGGLNLTHSEPLDRFMERYGKTAPLISDAVTSFPPDQLRQWSELLGEPTVIGSSGRVFPQSFKASPLARAWLRRLDALGVAFRFRHVWTGWTQEGQLSFTTPEGAIAVDPACTVLALGGASWPRLGSDGSWQHLLAGKGIAIAPLIASNVGVRVPWSDEFIARNAGAPLKGCAFTVGATTSRSEAVITRDGLEGGAIYALSAALRENADPAVIIDMKPDLSHDALSARLATMRKGESLANRLRKISLPPAALGLLRHAHGSATPGDLAAAIKSIRISTAGTSSIERAISTAGGIPRGELTAAYMLTKLPGVFAAGEMLDWDAPTGGYLLQACFATGVTAANGAIDYLRQTESKHQGADTTH